MKQFLTTLLFCISLITINFAQDGELDPSFDEDGIVQLNVSTGHENGHGIVVQPDGKILVAFSAGYPGANNFDIAVIRLLEDGTIDSTFATDGIYHYANTNASDLVYHITLLDDGSMLVAGSHGWEPANTDFLIFKLTTDGVPDPNFGTDGISIIEVDSGLDYARGLAVNAAGQINVVGYSHVPGFNYKRNVICRLNEFGELDTSFGTNGFFIWNDNSTHNEMYHIEILNDGGLLACGYGNPAGSERPALYKVFPDGSGLDTSFGSNGEVLAPHDGKGYGMMVHSNGNILVTAGSFSSVSGNDLVVLAYHQDGSPNLDFGIDGEFKIDTDVNDVGLGITQQADGKIIACGESGSGFMGPNPRRFYSVRLTEFGMLDTTWGGTGAVVTQTYDSWMAWANDVTVQPDGRVLLTGVAAFTNNDLMVLRYGNAPVSFVSEQNRINFQIYPNPVHDKLFIANTSKKAEVFMISKIGGEVILKGQLNSQNENHEINLDGLPSGIFIISILGEDSLGSKIFQKL